MRPHHPWYRAATNSWYVEIDGQQHFLGKHPDDLPSPRKRKKGSTPIRPPAAIDTAYHRLLATDPAHLPKRDDLRVAVLSDLFLDFSQKHHTRETYQGYKDFLQDFCQMFGTLLGRDLKPLHVTRWVDSHPGWNGSRRNAIVAVKRVFNWADAEGVLQPNPIKNVKKPAQRHRDRVLSLQERIDILQAIKDQSFRDLVFAMMETGARPGEVRRVTAGHVNLELGIWIFKEHKTAK